MNQKPAVSFIICTYNRAAYLDDTLSSLLNYGSSEFPYEILVVDNNSTDRTVEVVEEFQDKTAKYEVEFNYCKEPRQGLSFARNRGIEESLADNIVFFDDDIRATKTLVPSWCTFFNQYPEALAAGGKIHVQFDAPRPKWMSHFLLPLLGHHDLGDNRKTYAAGKYPFGGNMGFRKELFNKIGVFNTGLGRKGKSLNAAEEKELFGRIRNNGISIHYLPEAFLYHRVDSSRLSKDFIQKQASGLGRSMKLQLKNAGLFAVLKNWFIELGKLFATIPISLGYILLLQGSKAKILFLFRWWIWQGYKTRSP